MLLIWNGLPVVCFGRKRSVGRLAAELGGTSGVLDISEIMQSSNHERSSSISQLTKGQSRDFWKLPKYFNGTTTSV